MAGPKLLGGRLTVQRNYAVLPPESFVLSALPGWSGTEATILAAPAMGARFTQYLLTIAPGGGVRQRLPEGIEAFFFVLEGEAELKLASGTHRLTRGGYAYVRPGEPYELTARASGASRLTWLKKRYEPLDSALPAEIVANENDIKGETYMGIEGALLKSLIPDQPAYDMAMNIFTFQPGKSLPMTECHVMEHGLIFLQGQGVYYLGDRWMEVQQGDFIWMGPYCPQSFYAAGDVPSRYIYYKNVNRDVQL